MTRTVTVLFGIALAASIAAAGCRDGRGAPEQTSSAVPAPPPQRATAVTALEQSLHGSWRGAGPCDGTLTFGTDGSFDRRHYSPGGNRLHGHWAVRPDSVPPTLVLTCDESDRPAYVGKTTEVKLVQVDRDALVYENTAGRQTRYARDPAQP